MWSLRLTPRKRKSTWPMPKRQSIGKPVLKRERDWSKRWHAVYICLLPSLLFPIFLFTGSMEKVQSTPGPRSHIPRMDLLCHDCLPNIALRLRDGQFWPVWDFGGELKPICFDMIREVFKNPSNGKILLRGHPPPPLADFSQPKNWQKFLSGKGGYPPSPP